MRLRQVDYPAVPEPAANGFTDAQIASVIAAYDRALTEANGRICWLRAYHGYEVCHQPE